MKESKFKEKFEIEYQGFVLYIFDIKRMEARLKGLPRISSYITYADTNERFQLDKPAFYIGGKPVWILLRDFPFSLELADIDLEKEVKSLGFRMPTASEIESKAKSLYAKMIFGKKMVDSSYYLISILLCILVGLVVHLIDRLTLVPKPPEAISNSTAVANTTITAIKTMRWFI